MELKIKDFKPISRPNGDIYMYDDGLAKRVHKIGKLCIECPVIKVVDGVVLIRKHIKVVV